jgi:hypothetical protein
MLMSFIISIQFNVSTVARFHGLSNLAGFQAEAIFTRRCIACVFQVLHVRVAGLDSLLHCQRKPIRTYTDNLDTILHASTCNWLGFNHDEFTGAAIIR